MKELTTFVEHVVKSVLREDFGSPPPGFLDGSVYKRLVYHGSNNPNITEFIPFVSKGKYGIYVSPSQRHARLFGSYLYEALININNPLVVENKREISPADLTKKDIYKLEESGYDSIVVSKNGLFDKVHEIVLFEPEQVWVTHKI